MTPEVLPLFPTAIYKHKIRSLLDTELLAVNNAPMISQGLGNHSSVNTYILELEELAELKNEILHNINVYFCDVLHFTNEVYITNSWINITDSNEMHMGHTHTNSIISGVYYIDVDTSQPLISFNRIAPPFLLNILPTEFNIFNSIEWDVPVENNSIVLFPSSCYHYVKRNESANKRISIAFNTFIRGQLGTRFSGADLDLR